MILVCGDAMQDKYFFGTVERISPEAPVPILRVERSETREGGAANVLANLDRLGMQSYGIFSAGPIPVRKDRYIANGQQLLRVDFDEPQAWITEQQFLEEMVKEPTIVVFSDYGKGALARIQSLIQACPPNATILVDPKGHSYVRYEGAHYIKPNEHEMRELVGGWTTEEELDHKAETLREDLNLRGLLLTRGARGMTLYTSKGVWKEPAMTREVYDVCGAGDTAIAAFAAALSLGMPAKRAMYYANKAAGIACGHLGTYAVSYNEVFNDLQGMS